jgi:hypothetical protein
MTKSGPAASSGSGTVQDRDGSVDREREHANALLRRPAVAFRLRPQGYKTWGFESEGRHLPDAYAVRLVGEWAAIKMD